MSSDRPMLERVVSLQGRASFFDWLIREHLGEVNGFADRLRYLRANPRSARPNEGREVIERCALHREALSMVGQSLLPSLDEWARERLAKYPEDAFAYGFALVTLGEELEPKIAALPDAAKAEARYGAEIVHLLE